MTSTRIESVTAPDAGAFDAHTVVPDTARGPGILLLQEIFGVSDYILSAAERIATLGYVVMAPDLYWRIEPGISLRHDEAGLSRGLELGQRFDVEAALGDCHVALEHLRGLPEVGGPAGVLGFCLGGTLAYHVAARSRPDTAVCYYGSGIPDALDAAESILCPVLFHFGGSDPYIPRDSVERARAGLEPRAGIEFRIHENAGHAFDNDKAPMFHNPDAAEAAWAVTVDFLHRTLPV
jgi:carboxymethylenebutenolidase